MPRGALGVPHGALGVPRGALALFTTYRADGRLFPCGFFVLMTRSAHDASCPDAMRVSFGRGNANLTLGVETARDGLP